MDKFGFRFSKSLGQNFLIDENMVDKILDGATLTENDVVLEIGPGIGVMTQAMSQRVKKVVSVEIDSALIPVLDYTLEGCDNVKVIHNDVLNVDLHKLIEEEFDGQRPKVVANLPYYVTTPIVMKFLEEHIPVTDIVIMIQKEVADRMASEPSNKTYGALSVAVQYYCNVSMVARVPKGVFMPQPGVDSAVVRLAIRDEKPVSLIDEAIFFNTVRDAFGKRRKTLLNALSSGRLGLEKALCREVLESASIDPKRRGETLSIDEFATLANAIAEKMDS